MATASNYYLSDSAANKNGYRTKKRNIPFYGPEDKKIKVKLLYDRFDDDNEAAFREALPGIRTRALNRIILHYFPEYYIYYRTAARNKSKAWSGAPDTEMAYRRLRDTLRTSINAVHYRPHDPSIRQRKSIVLATLDGFGFDLSGPEVEALKLKTGASSIINNKVANMRVPDEGDTVPFLTRNVKELKEALRSLELLPNLEQLKLSLDLFNRDEGITAGTKSTTLQVSSLMRDSSLAEEGLQSYQRQLNGFEGSLPINLNFNDMQRGMMQVLNGVVVNHVLQELTDVHYGNFTFGGPHIDFSEADTITLSFGKKRGKDAIAAISYFVRSSSLNRQPLRTGYMTNIVYNPELNDPLILATLKNYESLVRAMELANTFDGPASSFMDWLDNNPEDFGSKQDWDAWKTTHPIKPAPTDHLLLREAHRLGIIDLKEVDNLEKGFASQLTPEQLERYKREVRDNPELYAKVRAAARKKVLQSSIDITKQIEDILNQGPQSLLNDSPLGQVLRKIGIDELAKEAWICATFGLGPAFGRVAGAASSSIGKVARGAESARAVGNTLANLPKPVAKRHDKPKPPKPSLRIPKLDPPKLQTFDGDLWDELLKTLLDALMQGVMEIIKALAKLLKESCKLQNPRAEDFGATDVGELVNNNLSNEFDNLPNISNNSALDQIFQNDGLTPDQVLGGPNTPGYLSALSEILSSMEICFLFTNRAELSDVTIDKIINFNLTYEDLAIRRSLVTRSAILGFFANLERFVDISDFCNELANELYQANIDNICLLEEAAPSKINDLLLEMADDGLDLDNPGAPYPALPGINLKCPRRDDFINNPLMNNAIPTLLHTAADVIESEFVNSVSAAQQILKEPSITQTESSKLISETIDAASRAGQSDSEASLEGAGQVSSNIMSAFQEVFEGLDTAFTGITETCDVASMLGVEANEVLDVISTIGDVILDMMNNPEMVNAIQGVTNRIGELEQAQANQKPGGASPIATQYEFPVSFKDKFEGYLDEGPTFNPSLKNRKPKAHESLVSSKLFRSTTPLTSKGYKSYRPVELEFTLPRKERTRFIKDPAGRTYGTLGIPKFVKVVPPPDAGDYLKVVFPTANDAVKGGTILDATLKSSLLPGKALNNFDVSDEVGTTPGGQQRNANPYVSQFSDKVASQLEFQFPLRAIDKERMIRELDTLLFPAAFAGQVEGMFNFIQTNGIFDTAKLDSLNFFHNNAGCLPENVADLMNMGPSPPGTKNPTAILDLIQEEMLDAMCEDQGSKGDSNPDGTRIRDVVRFAMFLMLIQLHIAQFVIKNIFVFSAFEVDDLLALPTVNQFMSVTIRNQIIHLLRAKPLFGEKIVEYYNKKIQRSGTRQAGGLLGPEGEIVFPAGRGFGPGDLPAIVEYASQDLIFKSRTAVSNAIKRASSLTNPKSFERAFIEDVLTVQPSFLGNPVAPPIAGEKSHRIWFLQNKGRGWGSVRASGLKTSSSKGRRLLRKYRGIAKNKFINDDAVAKTFRYGKLVLERQVVWKKVSSTDRKQLPKIISRTTGYNHGLELNLFKELLFGDLQSALGHGRSRQLRFTDLAIKYNIVYYLPDDRQAAGKKSSSRLFFEVNPLNVGAQRIDLYTGEDIRLQRVVLARLGATLPLGRNTSLNDRAPKNRYVGNRWTTVQEPILETQLLEYDETVSNTELDLITNDTTFNNYFGATFNRTITSLVPIMYNFYLTTDFFPKMDRILMGAKHRCIDIFINSVLDENTTMPPPPTRYSPQARAADEQNMNDVLSTVNQSARDFFLKMLIETPINILRGVSEMMDPHVGIAKIIRDITAMLFNEMAKGLDASEPIRFLREGPAVLEEEEQDPSETAIEDPLVAGTDTTPIPEAEGEPAGTILMKLPHDRTWEYARRPNSDGTGQVWLTRKKVPGGASWINLTDPTPNQEAINKLEKEAIPQGQEEVVPTPEVAQGIVEYRIPGQPKFIYGKNAAGEWLGKRADRSYTVPWEKAHNFTRNGPASGLQLLEARAEPVNPPPDVLPEDDSLHASLEGTAAQQAAAAAADAEAAAVAAASLADLPTDVVLRRGMYNDENVRILQAKLESLGHTIAVDGDFGDETHAQVEEFQATSAITIDGIVGPETWGALQTALLAAEVDLEEEAVPGVGPFPNITGEKVMELLFCALAQMMEVAASGYVLGPGSATYDTLTVPPRAPAPDSSYFLGEDVGGLLPGLVPTLPGAMFIGNPPKNLGSLPEMPKVEITLPNGRKSVVRPAWDGLKYLKGMEDPRDPRNNVPDAIKDNVFPRINMDGVDFTGTFLGLLMLPPGPFGIVYLLLMLLKSALDEALTEDLLEAQQEPISNVSEDESASEC